ncbi:hypothetical protein ATG_15510 [Desulfurococcaceae archaeon AG1]|nr:hypothetical protein ATG_15510 [Desulfurococcaceae archaeon AG1]
MGIHAVSPRRSTIELKVLGITFLNVLSTFKCRSTIELKDFLKNLTRVLKHDNSRSTIELKATNPPTPELSKGLRSIYYRIERDYQHYEST